MSKKITFKEWEQKQDESCNKNFDACSKSCLSCGYDSNPANAWHFAQAQEQREISELKKKLETCQECDYDNCNGCKLFEGE